MNFLKLFLITIILLNSYVKKQAVSENAQYRVDTIDKSNLEKLIKNRNGKVLFLNVWATWCLPCKEEFPDIVKLSNTYIDIEIVGLSVDYPDEVESKIIPFIKSHNVKFKIFVQDFRNIDDLINYLNKDWNGGIPTTFIFDTTGTQRAFIFGKHNYNYFKQEIEKVINDL
jgi:thiol-disulfide isomerase/thioredoxin